MLRLRDVSVGYPGAAGPTLSGVSLDIEPGSFICLLGRNGSGKSTLLRSLAGLQPLLGGEVGIDGKRLDRLPAPERARRIAVVLTERVAAAGLTVQALVETGRQPFTGWLGTLTDDDRRRADAALAAVGGEPFRTRALDTLSDGERQRIMIARAIAQQPRLLLLDEVTAFLDLPGRVAIMAMLRRHARATSAVAILSSHDLDLSLQLADIIWLLDGERGLSAGTAEELVTTGDIGRAFDTDDVRFSRRSHRFELAEPRAAEVS